MTAGTPPRRTVLAMGAAGVVSAVTGCTVYGAESDPPQAADGGADGSGDGTNDDSGDDSGGGLAVLATTSEIEVGGGLILADQQIVLTQPSDGEFKGFSSTCTHQACTVNSVNDGTINCPCHGSRFSIEDGSVVQAATGLTPESQRPLPEIPITVDGGDIRVSQ